MTTALDKAVEPWAELERLAKAYRDADTPDGMDAAHDALRRHVMEEAGLAPVILALLNALREQGERLAEARGNVCAFLAPWAVSYARDHGYAKGELHPVHYDILEKAGARMTDFTRAALTRSEAQ